MAYPSDTAREQLLERPLPNSAEAERAILGAIILDNALVSQAIELLKPEDFYVPSHRRVFLAMIALFERGSEINPILIAEELRREGEVEAVGGTMFISNLIIGLPHFTNIAHYAKMVRDKSMLRQLVKVCNKVTSEALEEEDDAELILDHAEQMIFALADERTRQGFAHVKPIADNLLEHVQEMAGRSAMLTGLTTGFNELDSMTSGLQPAELIVVAARPSMGKCVSASTLVINPQTGERLTVEEFVRRRIPLVYGLSRTGEVRPARVGAWVDSGVKPCFRVRTRTGRSVEVTGHHPFLTVNGWTPLYELSAGDKIGVPRVIPAFGNDETMPLEIVRLIAYFIAEGGLTARCPTFTNTDPVLVRDFQETVFKHFPECVIRQDRITYKIVRPTRSLWKSSPNPVTMWLKSLGLWGKLAAQKSFPNLVWRWSRERLAEFLRVLFSCDGTVYSMQGYPRIEFAVASEKLAQDAHHALLRFGVVAKLWRKSERCWRVEITEPESVALYQEQIGWLGEKVARCVRDLPPRRSNVGHAPGEAWQLIRVAAAAHGLSLTQLARLSGEHVPVAGFNPHTKRGIPRQRLMAYSHVLNDVGLARIAGRDIYWDEIVSVEPIGNHQVYDLAVPDGANFIAQDVCVHNTSMCLTIAQNAAIQAQAVVGIFSLEMSKESLVMRMLSSEARVDAHRFRSGFLSRDEWARLAGALGTLAETKIFIDDTPGISVLEMRAKSRRLAAEQKKLDLIIVDYLQLMSGSSRRTESRQQEVSQISRELKGLAKELNVPLIALSQLSRAPEARTDHRPQLADLRECVTGDTLVLLADGSRVPIEKLVGTEPEVLALSPAGRIITAKSEKVWAVGRRPVFEVLTTSGRRVRATAKHRLRLWDGWKRVSELRAGDRLAIARRLPEPVNTLSWPDARVALLGQLIGDGSYLKQQPMRYTTGSEENSRVVTMAAQGEFGAEVKRYAGRRSWHQLLISGNGHRWKPAGVNQWLRGLGIFDQRSHEKRIPDEAFRLSNRQIGLLLRHLWATDGCIYVPPAGTRTGPKVHYSTNSPALARDVAALLLRLGIVTRTYIVRQGQHLPAHHVAISGIADQLRFLKLVGAFGPRVAQAEHLAVWLSARQPNTNVDTLPRECFDEIKLLMSAGGISQRMMAAARSTSYGGTSHFSFAPSRAVVTEYASLLGDNGLANRASDDLFWDQVAAIEPAGEEEVYDLTVPGPESWLADAIISHNSGAIEQDADVVAFIYREEQYNRTEENAGIAEIILAKQRNGPTGTAKLAFLKEFTRFENMWRE